MTTRNDIERVLWSACDSFRNKIDSSRYKDYILAMLFIKYLSDVYRETREKYIEVINTYDFSDFWFVSELEESGAWNAEEVVVGR